MEVEDEANPADVAAANPLSARFRERTESDPGLPPGLAQQRGIKRFARSPPSHEGPLDLPPPISDVELREMRESLASQDYNFANINAVSKESAVKKKELEGVISAYRRAVCRLTDAYIQLRAERDTTFRIWRGIRSDMATLKQEVQSKQFSPDQAAQLTEIVRSGAVGAEESQMEMRLAGLSADVADVKRGLGDFLGSAQQQPRSYAGAVQSGMTQPAIQFGRQMRAVNWETIEVMPDESSAVRFADAMATKEAITKAIDPGAAGIRIDRLIKSRNKAVRIVASPSEIEKIRANPDLKRAGLEVKSCHKLNPRLVVRDIPPSMSREALMSSLISQNCDGLPTQDVKLIYLFPNKNRNDSTSAVIEVPSEIRRRMLERGRIYVGWTSCRVADHLRLTQCFRCLSLGHIAKDCKLGKDVCGHCADSHETRQCPNRERSPKCHNCTVAGSPSTDHSALDTATCPFLRRKLTEKSKFINY